MSRPAPSNCALSFENADGALFPNQFVNIQLLQELLKNQVIMPNSAVRRGAPNGVVTTFVYVVKPDSTVSVRPITLGVVDGERAAVTAGLAVGEVVVTEGGDRLRDGAKVLASAIRRTVHRGGRGPAHASEKRPPGAPNGQHRKRLSCKPAQHAMNPLANLHPASRRNHTVDGRDTDRRCDRL